MSSVVAANRRTVQGILATITYLPLCWHNRGSEEEWLEVCRPDGPKVRCSTPLLSASLHTRRGASLFSFSPPPHHLRAGASFNHHVPRPAQLFRGYPAVDKWPLQGPGPTGPGQSPVHPRSRPLWIACITSSGLLKRSVFAFLIWLTRSCGAPLLSAFEATSSFSAGKFVPFR